MLKEVHFIEEKFVKEHSLDFFNVNIGMYDSSKFEFRFLGNFKKHTILHKCLRFDTKTSFLPKTDYIRWW